METSGVPAEGPWAAPRTRPRPTEFWSAVLVRAVCGTVTWSAVALVGWVLLPVLGGSHAAVITSGSMGPAIRVGDVVVSRPYDGGRLDAGTVVTFRTPGDDGLVTHRVVGRDGPGTYRTKGDANTAPDSDPVEAGRVQGLGRYVVPAVGLPTLWLRNADHAPLLASVLATGLLVAGACRPVPTTAASVRRPSRRATRGTGSRPRTGPMTTIPDRPAPDRPVSDRPVPDRPATQREAADWPGPLWTARPPRRRRPFMRRGRPAARGAAVVGLVATLLTATVSATAALRGTTVVAGSWSSDGLGVPQDLAVTRNCIDTTKHTTVSWSAVSAAGGAEGYHVHRADETGGPYELVAELVGLDATEYTREGSALDTSSYYVVRAVSRSTSWRSPASQEVRSAACA